MLTVWRHRVVIMTTTARQESANVSTVWLQNEYRFCETRSFITAHTTTAACPLAGSDQVHRALTEEIHLHNASTHTAERQLGYTET
jgi:hypothetical protein